MRIISYLIISCSFIGCLSDSKPPVVTPETTPTVPAETTPTPTTETALTEEAWAPLLSALSAETAEPPPARSSTGSPQVFEGMDTIGLQDPAGGLDAELGFIHATKPVAAGQPYDEKWVVYDPAPLLQVATGGTAARNVTLRAFALTPPDKGELTADRITTYCARPDAANLKRADQSVNYFAFPGPTAITSLASQPLPNTTAAYTYEVWTSNQGNLARSGTLYRELQTPATGPQVQREFWVLEDDYIFPSAGVFTQIRPVSTGAYTTLRAFMEAMQTQRNAETDAAKKAKWRYSPVSFSWVPLCATP